MSNASVVRFMLSPFSGGTMLKLAEQAPVALDLIIDAATAQSVPDDHLQGRHDVHAELALQRLNALDSRPGPGGHDYRISVRIFLHQRLAEPQGTVARNSADLVERRPES